MSTEITEEAVQQTLQGYLTIATKTGELRGVNVEFTADGVTWHPLVFDLADGAHPIAARARVHRAGWAEPTHAPELWDEVVPAEEGWRALWLARPHVLFGAHTLRAALRRTFADVLGDRREPDDLDALPAPSAPTPASDDVEAIDWLARVNAATTIDALNTVRTEARLARAVTLPLKQRMDARRDEIGGDAWATPASTEQTSAAPKRREPQDYRPSENRAARRKASRKKGGRR
ncbi:hypothetical protein RU09_11925 [Microbacterium sp. MEJ108Y]|uniref:hypothetical protein n=1 Tax=Microbacterium sp. MEJ108Y TaxID=1587523 RepID=UPI0005ABCD24|nr:hypothetical protein [Microbacterium sp. MEJ108Y]KIP90181.1 hypothetical protein RU09_11925 [Microbacterium sp. MEJ108Y]